MKKKKLFLLVLISASLSLSACGSEKSSEEVSSNPTTSETEGSQESSETLPSTETTEVPATENTENQEVSGTFAISYESVSDAIHVETYEDYPLVEVDYSYPVVSSDTYSDAAAAINAAIQEEVTTFKQMQDEIKSYAAEDYSISLEKGYEFLPYSLDLTSQVMRNDDNILSFVFDESYFTGGLHSNTLSYGLTFHTKTGEKLTLDSLSDDSNAFRGNILSILNQQISSGDYDAYIYPKDSTTLDVETVLLGDNNVWYFDNSGMSFISNPYELGPSSSGTFYFYIPYNELTGLKADFSDTIND